MSKVNLIVGFWLEIKNERRVLWRTFGWVTANNVNRESQYLDGLPLNTLNTSFLFMIVTRLILGWVTTKYGLLSVTVIHSVLGWVTGKRDSR